MQQNRNFGQGMENHPRWGIAFLAAQSSGARIVPFDILHSAKTLAYLVQHSDCKYLISSEEFSPKLQKVQNLLPTPLPGLIKSRDFYCCWGFWWAAYFTLYMYG